MLAALAIFAGGAARAQDAAKPDAPAAAAPAPAKPVMKKKVRKGPAAVSVTVTNSRAIGLAELTAAEDGGAAKSIVKGLPAGKKQVISVTHGKTCVFDLHGTYDDATTTDVAGIDLCKDKTINLVE